MPYRAYLRNSCSENELGSYEGGSRSAFPHRKREYFPTRRRGPGRSARRTAPSSEPGRYGHRAIHEAASDIQTERPFPRKPEPDSESDVTVEGAPVDAGGPRAGRGQVEKRRQTHVDRSHREPAHGLEATVRDPASEEGSDDSPVGQEVVTSSRDVPGGSGARPGPHRARAGPGDGAGSETGAPDRDPGGRDPERRAPAGRPRRDGLAGGAALRARGADAARPGSFGWRR